MFVRVVRFTDATRERVDSLVNRIEDGDGPPEGVDMKRAMVLFDESQGSSVSLQFFETREAMEAGAQVLSAVAAGETPGTRASVDACEVQLDISA